MHPDRPVSASLPVLTMIQTLRSIGYCQIPQELVPRSTVGSFLSWSCFFEDHASGKTLSGLSCAALPDHGRIYGYRAKNLFQVTWRSLHGIHIFDRDLEELH